MRRRERGVALVLALSLFCTYDAAGAIIAPKKTRSVLRRCRYYVQLHKDQPDDVFEAAFLIDVGKRRIRW